MLLDDRRRHLAVLIPWLKQPLLFLAEPLGLRFAVLVAAFVLFAPPLTLLGMISPYAIRVRALSLDEVGKTAVLPVHIIFPLDKRI